MYVARGEGSAPEINITKAARFDELENVNLAGCTALPTNLLRHV